MGSRGGPGSPLCLQILTQSSVQSMEKGADCEVLLLCHSASPNPAGWDEFSAQPPPPPPSSRTHLLSLPPRLEFATCEDAEITSAFSLFPFCAASLYPPLLSLSLSLSPALFSLPLATFHTNFKQIFSEPKYCTHRRKSRAVCGSTRYEYIIRENQLEKQLRRKF